MNNLRPVQKYFNEIAELLLPLETTDNIIIFVRYSPHVETISLDIHDAPWHSKSYPIITFEISTSKYEDRRIPATQIHILEALTKYRESAEERRLARIEEIKAELKDLEAQDAG